MPNRDITVIPLRSTLESVGSQYNTDHPALNPEPVSITYLRKCKDIAGWPFEIRAGDDIYRRQQNLVEQGEYDIAWGLFSGRQRDFMPLVHAVFHAPTDRVIATLPTGSLEVCAVTLDWHFRHARPKRDAHKKIILTGAMKPMAGWGGTRDARNRVVGALDNRYEFEDAPGKHNHGDVSHLRAYRTSDGYQNLVYAVERLQDDATAPGVYIAMHGKLYEPHDCEKDWDTLTLKGTPVHEREDRPLPTRRQPTALAIAPDASSRPWRERLGALLQNMGRNGRSAGG